jgi:MHS family alpha-ketoglutarate permease-like MFS transporter
MARATVAASVGNIVEWYDWVIYAIFAYFFAKQFFPQDSELASLVATFGVFAVGFLGRPVGSLTLGRITDRMGRVTTLTVTVTIMAVGSLAIGLAPTASSIGPWAAVWLTAARFIQGLALGAESSAVGSFLAESASHGRRGLLVSFYNSTIALGTLLGSLVGVVLLVILPTSAMMQFGWRIPFIIGGLIGVGAYFVRRNAIETLDEDHVALRNPLATLWRDHRSLVWTTVILGGALGLPYFTLVVSFAPFIQAIGGGAQEAQLANTVGLIVLCLITPAFGLLSDRIGRRPILIFGFTSMAVLTIPGVALLWDCTQAWRVFVAQLLVVIPLGAIQGSVLVTLLEKYPTALRGVGLGFLWSVSLTAFGGTGPVLAAWLAGIGMTYTMGAYFIVLMGAAAIVAWRTRESAFIPLAR